MLRGECQQLRLNTTPRHPTDMNNIGVSNIGFSRKAAGAMVIVALGAGVVIGFLSGYYGPAVNSGLTPSSHLTQDADMSVRDKLLGEINAEHIRENHR